MNLLSLCLVLLFLSAVVVVVDGKKKRKRKRKKHRRKASAVPVVAENRDLPTLVFGTGLSMTGIYPCVSRRIQAFDSFKSWRQ